jgi:hypothetical protein
LVLIIFVVSEKNAFEHFPIGSNVNLKMAATAGLSLTHDPMGKMFQNTSSLKPLRTIETKLARNDHWKVLYKISVLNLQIVEDLPMNIHVQFGVNHFCSFGEEGI